MFVEHEMMYLRMGSMLNFISGLENSLKKNKKLIGNVSENQQKQQELDFLNVFLNLEYVLIHEVSKAKNFLVSLVTQKKLLYTSVRDYNIVF